MKNRWMFFVVLCFSLGFFSANAHAYLSKLDGPKLAHCQHPKWSKDGKWVGYEVRHTRKSTIEIHLLNVVTKKKKIVNPAALQSGGFGLGSGSSKRGMVAKDLAWSPKKNKYLFSSNGTGSVFNIYQSSEGILKVNSRTKLDGQPSWSKKGNYIVFTSARSGKGDLYYVKIVGKRLKAKRLTKFNASTELFPVWSPKKNFRLAYLRHRSQSDRIYLINNIFSRKSSRLTRWASRKFRGVSELNPSWSPDGSKIAFYGVYSNGQYDLFVVDAKAGSNPKRLAKNVIKSDQFGPVWSPNGKHILYVQKIARNQDRIQAVNVATKAKKNISTKTVNNNELAITRRGQDWFLAFTAQGIKGSNDQNYRKLYLKRLKPF